MYVGIAKLTVVISESHSLKEKRMVIRRIKDRVKERVGVVINEVGGPETQDSWQRAELGCAVTSNERRKALELIDEVVRVATSASDVIVVVASPGSAGVLDATLQPAHYPTREYLVVDPPANQAGGTQTMVTRLADDKAMLPVTDAFLVTSTGAVAPAFTVDPDGNVTLSFEWVVGPSDIVAAGYVDSAGRGWVASARVQLPDPNATGDVAVAWEGMIPASGKLASTGRWLLGHAPGDPQNGEASRVIVAADANGDGLVGPNESLSGVIGPIMTPPAFFVTTAPTQVTSPLDIAGVIFDSNGDGARDRVMTIGADGSLADSPWPVE